MSNKEKILSAAVFILAVTVVLQQYKIRHMREVNKINFDRESKMFKEGTLKYQPK